MKRTVLGFHGTVSIAAESVRSAQTGRICRDRSDYWRGRFTWRHVVHVSRFTCSWNEDWTFPSEEERAWAQQQSHRSHQSHLTSANCCGCISLWLALKKSTGFNHDFHCVVTTRLGDPTESISLVWSHIRHADGSISKVFFPLASAARQKTSGSTRRLLGLARQTLPCSDSISIYRQKCASWLFLRGNNFYLTLCEQTHSCSGPLLVTGNKQIINVLLKHTVTLASCGSCLVKNPLTHEETLSFALPEWRRWNLHICHQQKCNNCYQLTDLDASFEERSPPQRQTDLLERFIDETGTSESPVNLDGLYLQLHLIQRLTVQNKTVINVSKQI